MSIEKVFPDQVNIKRVGHGLFELTSEFRYLNNVTDTFIFVPKGFITDGASIPKFTWSIIGSPWTGRYTRAAIVHDYLYNRKIFTRRKSDLIFYQAMKVLKVPFWKRWAMHKAVRACGWIPWRKNVKKNVKKSV